jgi:hypothetical protein
MSGKPWAYVHLLVFRCEQCAKPVAISVTTEEANLENFDSNRFMFNVSVGGRKHYWELMR